MDIGFFLGCVIPHRYPGIEKAIRDVFTNNPDFNVNIKELEGATCCPAPGVFGSFDLPTWRAISARNLSIGEEMGVDVMTACNGCYGSLFEVDYEVKHDAGIKAAVNAVLAEVGRKYEGNIDVKHFTDIIYTDIGLEKVKKSYKRDLGNLKVAVHYGCHWLKPSRIKKTDNPEKPHILEAIVESTGAEVIDYKSWAVCCGAGGGVRSYDKELSLTFTLEKFRDIEEAGANCILNMCPFCHLQLDLGQNEVEQLFNESFNLPVIHLAQFLLLAQGITVKDTGLLYNFRKFKPEDIGFSE